VKLCSAGDPPPESSPAKLGKARPEGELKGEKSWEECSGGG